VYQRGTVTCFKSPARHMYQRYGQGGGTILKRKTFELIMIQKNLIAALTIILSGLSFFSANSQDAEEIFQQGNSLSMDGKYKEALAYVDRSLNMDSSLYQRFGFRAELKFKLGMIEEAIGDISRCIDKCKCPTRKYHVSDYYLERSELQLLLKNQQAAMEDVNKSISNNPNNWKAYNFRSGLFITNGQVPLALADLNKSFAINNNEATTLIVRGKLKIEIGDLEGACSDLSKVADWGFDEFDTWIEKNCKK
jgi:tetratricopeptide (TPR) repeat protein